MAEHRRSLIGAIGLRTNIEYRLACLHSIILSLYFSKHYTVLQEFEFPAMIFQCASPVSGFEIATSLSRDFALLFRVSLPVQWPSS